MKYGKWTIEKNVKPIPDRRFDFDFYHEDYDGADGGNGLAGTAESEADALNKIKEIELERGDYILMPKALTAENGAKAVLMGEFYQSFESECPDCDGDGCLNCGYRGSYKTKVPVSWTTIKEIYAMAVKHLSLG